MLTATTLRLRGMSRIGASALNRTKTVAQHMMSTSSFDDEAPVKFESTSALRRYVLNRPSKLNALNEPMLTLLRPKIEEWNNSDLCNAILGTGVGRAFCAGGDVFGVVQNAANPETRWKAIDFF